MARTDAILTTEEIEIIQDIVDNGLSLETDVTGTLPINNGGTGATTASGARTNFSLYSQSEIDTKDNLFHYRIVTSVSSGNLTVALKNYLGDDPSVSVPVKVQIGGVVRTLTTALSKTSNAGTNWFNLGSTELANKECDIFYYFLWDGSNVGMAISRYPAAVKLGDLDLGGGNPSIREKGFEAIYPNGYNANYDMVVAGRFNATLSASPFNWSIPATSVILNRPVYETRLLEYTISLTGFSTVTQGATNNKYRIVGDRLQLLLNNNIGGTSNATTFTFTIPFSYNGTLNSRDGLLTVFVKDAGTNLSNPGHLYVNSTGNNTSIRVGKSFFNGAWTASGDKQFFTQEFTYNI